MFPAARTVTGGPAGGHVPVVVDGYPRLCPTDGGKAGSRMRIGVVLRSRRDRFGKVVLETLEELGCEILPIFPGMEGDIRRMDTLLLFCP